MTSRWPMYSSSVRGRRDPSTASSPGSMAPAARRLRASSVIAAESSRSGLRLVQMFDAVGGPAAAAGMPSWGHERTLHDRPDARTLPAVLASPEPGWPAARGGGRRRGPRREEDDHRAVAGGSRGSRACAAPDPERRGRGHRDGLPARWHAGVRIGAPGPGREAGQRTQSRCAVGAAARRRRGAPAGVARGRRVRDRHGPVCARPRVRRDGGARRARLRGRCRSRQGSQGGGGRGAPVRGLPHPPLGSLPRSQASPAVRGPGARRRGADRGSGRPRARGDGLHVRGVGRRHRPRRLVRGRRPARRPRVPRDAR